MRCDYALEMGVPCNVGDVGGKCDAPLNELSRRSRARGRYCVELEVQSAQSHKRILPIE